MQHGAAEPLGIDGDQIEGGGSLVATISMPAMTVFPFVSMERNTLAVAG
jgi:hypothetical protein